MSRIRGLGVANATFREVSCLKGFIPNSERRSGNTTKLIGICIDIIFSGATCLVRDHDLRGTNTRMNRYLFKRVEDRLKHEHRNIIDLVCFDRDNLAIYLFSNDEEKSKVLLLEKQKNKYR